MRWRWLLRHPFLSVLWVVVGLCSIPTVCLWLVAYALTARTEEWDS